MLKTIPGFDNYQITTDGHIWSIPRKHRFGYQQGGIWLTPSRAGGGRLQVMLCRDGKQYPRKVHRLVLETFVSPCPLGMEACHNNGIRTDNRLENLRWDTPFANVQDAKAQKIHTGFKIKQRSHRGTFQSLHDAETEEFFQSAVIDRRMSLKEFHELKGIGVLSHAVSFTTYLKFVSLAALQLNWPEDDALRVLSLRLAQDHLTPRHIEIYINYPAWTMQQLADKFSTTREAISRGLDKVRKVFPILRLDPSLVAANECPALDHMLRIETSANSDDRLNANEVIKF